MGALLGLLIPLIPSLIQGVERIFTKPKTGEPKIKAVMESLRQIIEQMMAAGIPLPDGTAIPEKAVSDDLLRGLIEGELAKLRTSGQLTGPAVTAGSGRVYLVREAALTEIR